MPMYVQHMILDGQFPTWLVLQKNPVGEDFLTSPFVGLFADVAWNEIGPKDFH